MKIIDGKTMSSDILRDIKNEILILKQNGFGVPSLHVVLCNDNPASLLYDKNKMKICNEIGIDSRLHQFPKNTNQEQILNLIDNLNNDTRVSGILLQLPLFNHLNVNTIISRINPEKDVDGFNISNVGLLWTKQKGSFPCTPLGCIELIRSVGVDLVGKHAVVVGRSNIVGMPMSNLLLRENCTVTIAHRYSENLPAICKLADVLVVATGIKNLINAKHIKSGAIIIDVGINRDLDGKIYGDVDFESIKNLDGFITPVPGGVGPMTIAMLMKNTLELFKIKNVR